MLGPMTQWLVGWKNNSNQIVTWQNNSLQTVYWGKS